MTRKELINRLLSVSSIVPPLVTERSMGNLSSWSISQVFDANPSCLRLLVQFIRLALDFARGSAGNKTTPRNITTATTTRSSMSVNASTGFCCDRFIFNSSISKSQEHRGCQPDSGRFRRNSRLGGSVKRGFHAQCAAFTHYTKIRSIELKPAWRKWRSVVKQSRIFSSRVTIKLK